MLALYVVDAIGGALGRALIVMTILKNETTLQARGC
jgi:hypothetical protein